MKRVYVLSLLGLFSFTGGYAALCDQKSGKSPDESKEQAIFRKQLRIRTGQYDQPSGWRGSKLEHSSSSENLLKAFTTPPGQCVFHDPRMLHEFAVQTCGVYFRNVSIDELRSLSDNIRGVSCSDGGIGRGLQEFYLAKIDAVVKPYNDARDRDVAALLKSLGIADNKDNRDKVIQFSVAQGRLPGIYKP